MNKSYLFDTLCWLWWHISPEKLSRKQYQIIEDGENEIYFSVISAWEINIKYRMNRLRLPSLPSKYISQRNESSRIKILNLQLEHTLYVENLPALHNDPIDRLLISQAQIEDMIILTNDLKFKSYDVPLIL